MNSTGIKHYFKSLFEAVAAIHKRGVIHKDLKPANFLYSITGAKGFVCDFGISLEVCIQILMWFLNKSTNIIHI